MEINRLLILSAILVGFVSSIECSEGELEILNIFKQEDCQRKAKPTDMLTVNYKGNLQGGEVFDSSFDREQPFSFQLGVGQVLLGWEKGLKGVCAGDKLKLVVPPSLGYGDAQQDKIPPHSTLEFEIEVLKIEDGPNPANVFREIDVDNDQRLSRKEVAEYLKKQMKHEQHQGDPGTQQDSDHMQIVDEIFMHEDKDKDEYITRDEFSGPKLDHDEL